MVREFEGKTEKEAIDRAIEELNLDREEFDVEIMEAQKKGILFRKGPVRIRVHLGEDDEDFADDELPAGIDPTRGMGMGMDTHAGSGPERPRAPAVILPPESEAEEKMIAFVEGVIERMGYVGEVSISRREDRKIVLGIVSPNTGILIGRKGKNLDALQLLANVFAARLALNIRVVVDAEDYRARREENLIRLAKRTAEQVRRSQGSRLLEPMNPFERRLIHTTLNELDDVDTKSEGDGLYKQVRVIFRGIPDR